mmetsp:Transcript_32730/g.97409  ORF Transcript_32730/g.97409 Transcript_32730/m.97409 type:complete len:238 (-) Transcript_32730:111-824(-)
MRGRPPRHSRTCRRAAVHWARLRRAGALSSCRRLRRREAGVVSDAVAVLQACAVSAVRAAGSRGVHQEAAAAALPAPVAEGWRRSGCPRTCRDGSPAEEVACRRGSPPQAVRCRSSLRQPADRSSPLQAVHCRSRQHLRRSSLRPPGAVTPWWQMAIQLEATSSSRLPEPCRLQTGRTGSAWKEQERSDLTTSTLQGCLSPFRPARGQAVQVAWGVPVSRPTRSTTAWRPLRGQPRR